MNLQRLFCSNQTGVKCLYLRFQMLKIYFELIFGLMNTNNAYLRLKCVLCGGRGFLTLTESANAAIPNLIRF